MDPWLQLLAHHHPVWRDGRLTHFSAPTEIEPEIFILSEHRLLTIIGAGAAGLLQGQLTCDISSLGESGASLAAHCNPKGRMLASFLVAPTAGGYALRVPSANATVAAAGLAKYAPFYKVAVVASDWLGIAARAPVDSDCGARFSSPFAPGLMEYWLPATEIPRLLEGRTLAAPPAYAAHQLAASLAEVTPATSGRYTPHDWHYPELGGVSFQKGCYTGQEIIARMHYRGRGKVALYRGRGDGLEVGVELELDGVGCQVVAAAAAEVLIAAPAPLPVGVRATPLGELELYGRALPE